MDTQIFFNIAIGLISFLGGWVVKMIWSRIDKVDEEQEELWDHHQEDLKEVRKEIGELALSLPEKYVAKTDLDNLINFINERFNKLESKIDDLKK